MAEARGRGARPHLLAALAWAIAVLLALKLGSSSDPSLQVVLALRLPRAILASAVGMGLAVAGACLQALFANPLCEPYTLGISSGASLGAVVASTLGLGLSFAGLAAPSFVGALAFTGVLLGLSVLPGSNNTRLLLAGVMLGFLGSSLVALWMALVDPNGLQSALFWLLGDLSRARLSGSVFTFFSVAALCVGLWGRWRELDALLLGEEGAAALGVDVARVRWRLVFVVSILISLCVSAAGMIGFVGLVVPHFSRRTSGALHLRMLPLCALWGATALTLADALARAVARPYELPVGVVSALFGAPLFLLILLQTRSSTGARGAA